MSDIDAIYQGPAEEPRWKQARHRAVQAAAEHASEAVRVVHGTAGAMSVEACAEAIQMALDAATSGEYDDQELFGTGGPLMVHFDRKRPGDYWDLFTVYVRADTARCYYRQEAFDG